MTFDEQAQQIVIAQITQTPHYFARNEKGRTPDQFSGSADFVFDPVKSGEVVGRFYTTVLKELQNVPSETITN